MICFFIYYVRVIGYLKVWKAHSMRCAGLNNSHGDHLGLWSEHFLF